MASPFCCDTRVQIEKWENSSHFEIHHNTSHQADHEEDGTRGFKHFNFSIVKQVQCESSCEENTNYRDGENGNSI